MNRTILPFKSLKTRLTVLTLIIFLFGVWSLVLYASKMLRQDIQHMLSDQQFTTVSFMAQEIDQELEIRLQALDSIAAYLSPAMQNDRATVQTLLERRSVFQSLFNGGTFVTGTDGLAIADVPIAANRIGVNYLDRDFLLAALQNGKPSISQPVMGKKLLAPVLAMATPIQDTEGKIIGALIGATDLSKANFLSSIVQNNYGKTGGFLLISPQHRLFITGTDQSLIMQTLPAPGNSPLLDQYLQGFEGSGIINDAHRVEVLSSAKQIPAASWLVVAEIPTAEAFAPIVDMQKRMLLMAIFLTLLAGGLTWWMVHRQLAPMLAVAKILTVQAGAGLPAQPLPITHQDEIGELIGGFNRLLENLTHQDKALRANRKHLSNVIEFLPTATLAIDRDGRVIIWNKAIEAMTGIPAAEMLGKGNHAYMIPFYGEARMGLLDLIFNDRGETLAHYPDIVRQDNILTSEVFCHGLYGNKGAWVFVKAAPLYDDDGNIVGAIESIRDISDRKLLNIYDQMSQDVMQILTEPGTVQKAFEQIVTVLKKRTGLDAVGIRLEHGEDFPYLAQEGFSQDFLKVENSLFDCCAKAGLCRAGDGHPVLEGACGMVISGNVDPANPLFTQWGSFWVNDSSRLLDTPSDQERRYHPRNYCVQQGYQSIALIPIHAQTRIVGLIHLNGKEKDCFTRRTVELLEGIASHIGAALMRKRAEQALRESEARYAATLSVLQTGLWDWHIPSGQATYSGVYYRILGYQDGEFPASYHAWHNLVHPDDIGKAEDLLQQSFAFGSGIVLDIRMKMKSGGWKWVALRGKTVEKDVDGKALRMVGTLTDISERIQAEEERQKLQAQLIQSQKMQAIGTLAGGIAHDFNNILGAIIGYSEMIQDQCPKESTTAQYVNQVLKAGDRAKDLVKQILAFSRQHEAHTIPVQPATIIKEAIKLLRASLPATITIEQDIQLGAGVVLADPTQIHQIVMNLCTNAFHAMEAKGGTLTISLHKKFFSRDDLGAELHLSPGRYIELSVKDTGEGIRPEIREKIFDPFFTTKEVGKGTGMGLSMVYGIVQSFGGSIKCESEFGEGTVFQVLLPVVADEEHTESSPISHIQGGSERLLFVDDEEMLADMGKNMLEGLGYRVTVKTNSLEALATLQSQPHGFDLVITDQTMPGMTGSDLAKHILQVRPEMPIILCTGYSSVLSAEKAVALGIKGFAFKPLARKDIAALIRKLLDGEQ